MKSKFEKRRKFVEMEILFFYNTQFFFFLFFSFFFCENQNLSIDFAQQQCWIVVLQKSVELFFLKTIQFSKFSHFLSNISFFRINFHKLSFFVKFFAFLQIFFQIHQKLRAIQDFSLKFITIYFPVIFINFLSFLFSFYQKRKLSLFNSIFILNFPRNKKKEKIGNLEFLYFNLFFSINFKFN